eukprot:492360-Prorocentrum_minimum.AAC.1
MRRTLRWWEQADPKKEAAKTPKQRSAPVEASITFAYRVHQLFGAFSDMCHTLIVDLRTVLQQMDDLTALEESAAQLTRHEAATPNPKKTPTGGRGGEAAPRHPRTRPPPSPAVLVAAPV